jgi:hypothetical protein
MFKLKPDCILRTTDGAQIPMDEGNADYQAYLAWCDDGNTPEAADIAPNPFIAAKTAELASYVQTREVMCARVAGIGQRLARKGDDAGALSCDAVVDALLDVTKHASVTSATDINGLKAALKARYAAAVALASGTAKAEFVRYAK